MRAPRWAYLWPGLARVRRDGDFYGLLVALLFSLFLNLAIISSFVWPKLLAPEIRVALWLIVAAVWFWTVGSAWFNWVMNSGSSDRDGIEDLFSQAQTEYLRGNWYKVEHLLGKLLSRNDQDLEALLLLASMLRATRRFGEAKKQLRQLGQMDGASAWRTEIEREWNLVETYASEVEKRPKQADAA